MGDTKTCEYCWKEIDAAATRCPHCAKNPDKKETRLEYYGKAAATFICCGIFIILLIYRCGL